MIWKKLTESLGEWLWRWESTEYDFLVDFSQIIAYNDSLSAVAHGKAENVLGLVYLDDKDYKNGVTVTSYFDLNGDGDAGDTGESLSDMIVFE